MRTHGLEPCVESPHGGAGGAARGPSAGRRCKGPPRLRRVPGLRGRTGALGLRYGPDSYGRQQLGILDNGGNSDPVTPREGRRSSDCKLILSGKKKVTVPEEKGPANYVPAAAVIRRVQALSGFTGCKGRVDGAVSQL